MGFPQAASLKEPLKDTLVCLCPVLMELKGCGYLEQPPQAANAPLALRAFNVQGQVWQGCKGHMSVWETTAARSQKRKKKFKKGKKGKKERKKEGNSKTQSGKMYEDIWNGRDIVYNRRIVQIKPVWCRGRWGTDVYTQEAWRGMWLGQQLLPSQVKLGGKEGALEWHFA